MALALLFVACEGPGKQDNVQKVTHEVVQPKAREDSFERRPYLKTRGLALAVATNAGIFSAERRPTGLHVQGGETLTPLSTEDGEGNFFLKPNGVFWRDDVGVHVAATERFVPQGPVQLATQSGPLLLDRGQLTGEGA